ncbi:MAG: fibronectin type III domain-containing protein [Anaerolineae bacterium]|nr:fibronectin type III domain-containing protein [Gemmatimonadaceae bacterium]
MLHLLNFRAHIAIAGVAILICSTGSLAGQEFPPPTNVTVAGAGNSVTVSWSPVSGKAAASYRVLRALDGRSTGVDLTRPIDVASFVDATVTPGTTYFYQVIAVYEDKTTGAAVPVPYMVPAASGAPSSMPGSIGASIKPTQATHPVSLSAVATGIQTVDLTWPVVAGISQYRVFGPQPLPLAGAVVSTQPFRITGVPAGVQRFAVSSEYRGAANGPGLPEATIVLSVFGPMNPGFGHLRSNISIERLNTIVDINFLVSKEPASFRLFRDQIEITSNVTWDRTPQSGFDRVFVRSFPPDLLPQREYRYVVAATMPNGDTHMSAYTPVKVPLFNVRATVPIAADRIVVEWNQFGTAPYQIKKGTTIVQGGSTVLALDFVRDAAGNPINFTGVKYDDFTVQRGVKYYYTVCAAIPSGHACPGVEATVP